MSNVILRTEMFNANLAYFILCHSTHDVDQHDTGTLSAVSFLRH